MNLWRRKRVAWLLSMAVLALSAVSHLLKGLDYEEASLALALALGLWVIRKHFSARSDPPSIRRGLYGLGVALLAILAYGTLGFYLLDRHFSVNFGLGAAIEQTVVMFTQFYDPGLEPITGFGAYFADSIYGVAIASMGYALLMLLRPVLQRGPADATQRARAGEIVAAHGRSSLARMTLLPDKQYRFSAGGCVVAYALEGRVGLALGDPIGPEDAIPGAIADFQAFCAANDWLPVFYQTLPDHLEAYRAQGFSVLTIGQEAIVDLASFSLAGSANKTQRNVLNRFRKQGYQALMHLPPVEDDLLEQLRVVSDEWLAEMQGSEKGFSLGWFDKDYLRDCPVMVVSAPEGRVTAFTNLVPEYQVNEATIDLMRQLQGSEHGTMDFLMLSLIEWTKAQGYASFSLGLCSLAGVGESATDPAMERAVHYVYEHLDQFYSFQGLRAYKAKFGPHWSPRYLAYPSAEALPAVSLALVRADSGSDFVWSYLQSWLRSRKRPKATSPTADA